MMSLSSRFRICFFLGLEKKSSLRYSFYLFFFSSCTLPLFLLIMSLTASLLLRLLLRALTHLTLHHPPTPISAWWSETLWRALSLRPCHTSRQPRWTLRSPRKGGATLMPTRAKPTGSRYKA